MFTTNVTVTRFTVDWLLFDSVAVNHTYAVSNHIYLSTHSKALCRRDATSLFIFVLFAFTINLVTMVFNRNGCYLLLHDFVYNQMNRGGSKMAVILEDQSFSFEVNE